MTPTPIIVSFDAQSITTQLNVLGLMGVMLFCLLLWTGFYVWTRVKGR